MAPGEAFPQDEVGALLDFADRCQEDTKMDIGKGDYVLVNLAAFIGSVRPSEKSIPCQVLAADATHVEVRTLPPFREFCLRVESNWIEGKWQPDHGIGRSGRRSVAAREVCEAASG
jgi:hypothetical protein